MLTNDAHRYWIINRFDSDVVQAAAGARRAALPRSGALVEGPQRELQICYLLKMSYESVFEL